MGKNRDFSKFPNAITVLDNGNVGIGVTSIPSQNGGALSGSAIINGIMRIQGVSGRYFQSGDGLEMSKTSIYSYNRDTSSYNDLGLNDSIYIKGGGSVGFGTGGPTRGIHISRNSDQAAILITKASDTANVAYLGTGSSSTGAGTENAILQMWHNGTENIRLYTQGNSWITGGNFGIGTSSPQRLLDARGFVNLGTTTPSVSGGGYSDLHLRTWSGATSSPAKIQVPDNWFDFYSTYTDGYRFRNYSSDGVARDLMVISSGSSGNGTVGAITIPAQPSFTVVSNVSNQTLSGGTVIPFNIARYNTGSYYNTSTGRFTAPVTGKYLFTYNFYIFANLATSIVLTINGSQYVPNDVVPLIYKSSATLEQTQSNTIILDLSVNDYVELRVRAGGNATIYMSHSHFSGHLLA